VRGGAQSELCRERQEQLAAEHIVETVSVRRTAGDENRVGQRRILVEHVVGAGADATLLPVKLPVLGERTIWLQ
jgi:hypothetical protein